MEKPGIVARFFDSLVSTVAPVRAVRRLDARETTMKRQALRELRASYEAARRDRGGQVARVGSADHHLHADLATIRDASRRLVRDDAHAAAAIRVKVDNVVGAGINVQAAVQAGEAGISESEAQQFNESAEANWRAWCASNCDGSGHGDFHDLTRLIYQTRLVDGESFVHQTSIDRDGVPTMALELVDADRIDSDHYDGRSPVRNGVQLDANGRATGYWVRPYHPDDLSHSPDVSDNEATLVAAKVGHGFGLAHIFERQRPGQTRGVPLITPALPLFEHLHHYLDSEIIAARVNSNFAMYVRRPVDPDTDPNIVAEFDDYEAGTGGASERFLESSSPGTIEYLNPGEEIQSFSHNRPGTTFDPFVMRLLRAIAAACNLPYELILKDFAKMNYSSARVALLEARRGFDCDRGHLVGSFVRPTYETVTRDAMEAGRLPISLEAGRSAAPFLRARFIPAPYGLVDPTKEIAAASESIKANLSTPDQEAARAGMDAGEILEARARHLRKAIDLEDSNDLPPGALSGLEPPAPEPAAEPPAPPAREPEPEPEAEDE